MAATAVEGDFYHRRLDRGPEKEEYFHLPKQDQQLICQLRSAMDGTREKVTSLRDTIEDKDRDISRESALRKAAEARLEQLVDMYGDPSVMEELRDRLPRAGKEDVKEKWSKELAEMKQSASQSYKSSGARRSLERDIESQIIGGKSRRGTSKSPGRRGGGGSDSEEEFGRRRRQRSHSPVRDRRGRTQSREDRDRQYSRHRADDSGYTSFPGTPFQGFPSPPYGGYIPAMFPYQVPQMMYSPMQGMPGAQAAMAPPTAHSTPVAAQSMQGQAMSGPAMPGPPMYPGYSPGPQGAVITNPNGQNAFASDNQPGAFGNLSSATSHPGTYNDGSAISTSTNNVSSGTRYGALGSTGMMSRSTPNLISGLDKDGAAAVAAANAKEISANREQNRQLSLLLTELDSSKDLNTKLQERLSNTEKELQTLKIISETKDAQLQSDATGKVAELVEEIYRAQKKRDEAMLGRLRIANEERDEAMLKLRQRETTMDDIPPQKRKNVRYELHSEDIDGDLSLKELLSEIETADSPVQINSNGSRIVDTINARKQRKRLITTEEMKAILEERDSAVAKCKKMEGELLRLQRQTRGRTPDKQQQAALQPRLNQETKLLRAKLLATQQERDMALTKTRKLEEELQTLRVYYSLHKSLSQEANLRDQFNNTLENIEGQLKQRDTVVDMAQKQNNQLVAQLKNAIAEKEQVQQDLEKAQLGQKEAQANCEKLERLVNVLRRKINGLGSKSDD